MFMLIKFRSRPASSRPEISDTNTRTEVSDAAAAPSGNGRDLPAGGGEGTPLGGR